MNMLKIKQPEQILNNEAIDLIKINSHCDEIKQQIVQNNHNCDVPSQIVRDFIKDKKEAFLGDKSNDTKLYSTLECYILNQLHDTITPIYYKTFKEEDELIFQKCLSLQHVKFSLIYGDIRLPASIVELASLDAHKTVQEKMICLTTCYDMIFAELKHAMAELITENGECSEIPGNIPVVNNSDIKHVLVEVILGAKCKHLYSNLYFVQSLSDSYIMDKHTDEHVLSCFCEAVEFLLEISEQKTFTFRKTCSEIDLKQYNSLVQKLNESSISNSFERMSLTRISRQISKSHEYIGNL